MEQKQAIRHLKRKYLNINLLFIDLLYKINITFVIMLILKKKWHPLYVRSVGVLFGFYKILDIVKLHIIKTNITIIIADDTYRTPLDGPHAGLRTTDSDYWATYRVPQIFPRRANLLQSLAPTLIKLTYLWCSNDLEDSD